MSQSQRSSGSDPVRPTRRAVLEAALLGSAAAAAAPFVSSAQEAAASGAPPCTPQPYQAPPFELADVPIADLQAGLASGRWTSRGLVAAYLGRIEALNLQGPELRAVLETNPEAEAIASALDAERRDGKVRGPLHGIPILLKDNVDTADRMTTTAGSLALEGSIAPRDSTVAARLRYTAPFDMSGHPTLTLPGGMNGDGVPVGFQIVGHAFDEVGILATGHAFQRLTDWHLARPSL